MAWGGGREMYFPGYSREIKNSCVLLISTKLICTLFLWKLSEERKAIIFGSIDFRCRDFGFASSKWTLSAGKRPPMEGILHIHSGVQQWAVDGESILSELMLSFCLVLPRSTGWGKASCESCPLWVSRQVIMITWLWIQWVKWERGAMLSTSSLFCTPLKSPLVSRPLNEYWKIQKKKTESHGKCRHSLAIIVAILPMCGSCASPWYLKTKGWVVGKNQVLIRASEYSVYWNKRFQHKDIGNNPS